VKKLLALLVAALALASGASASERHPTLAEFENQVMCPVCAGETLAQSDSPAAAQVRRFIRARIAAGDTRSEIKRKLVAEYGPQILAAPPRHGFGLLAWVLPLAGILAAAGVLALLARRWSRRASEEPQPALGPWSLNGRPLDPDLERRLDEELARFDG
jgi:cytochrome c-type biogenesis protein CcmH